MRRQKCSQCGTMLDVTKLEKSAKFACANCGTILTVGEANVVKRSLGEGPAFQPKAKSDEPAPALERRRRSRTAADTGAAPKKSKAPLFIGIAVVVVGIGVAFALMGAGTEGGSGGGETAQSWWAAKRAQLAQADAATVRGWIQEAEQKGYTKDRAFWGPASDELMKRILEKDPTDVEANRRSGRVDLRTYPEFETVWDQMEDSFRVLSEDQKQLMDKYAPRVQTAGKPPVWVSAAEFASAKAVLDAFVEWRKAQGENPAAPRVAKATATAQQLLGKEYVIASAAAWPWVVLVALPGDAADRKAEMETKAQGCLKALAVLQKTYDEKIRAPLGLPEVDKDTFFIHLVCAKKDDVGRLGRMGQGLDRESDLTAFFSTDTRWFHAWLDPENENRVASDLCHGAVHQLQWFHSKDPKDKYENHFDKWAGLWLTEGLADWLGGGVRFDGTKAEWTGIAERRTAHLQSCKDAGWPLFPLRELVQFDGIDTLRRNAGSVIAATVGDVSKIPESANALVAQDGFLWYVKTLYAQSWHLAYFMNEYEGGKYKKQFHELVRAALSGKRKPDGSGTWRSAYDAFAEILGAGNDAAAWERLDREYAEYVNTALRKARQ